MQEEEFTVKTKVLITGGAGFIGSHFVKYILKKYKNYFVINLDKLTYAGNLENLSDIKNHPRYEFIKGDICNEKLVKRIIKECDIIVNFAAQSHVDRSINDPSDFLNTNIMGTFVLLESARKCGIKRFLQISTDEVYGSILKGSFTEESPLEPSSPYSASKTSADLLARSYYSTYGLPVVITRSSNNFGPNQYPEKIIPLFITNILENKKIPVYGDGLNVRNWLYVVDNCMGIDIAVHKGKLGEVYNIGSDIEKTNLELTYFILREMKKDRTFIEFVKDRLGHDRRYSLNYNKIKKLGFSPKYSFETAFKNTIKWYINNKSWWHPLKHNRH